MDQGGRSILEAVGLVCLAGFLFVVMNVIVKYLIPYHPVVELLWGRTFFHVAFVVLAFPRAVVGALRTTQLRAQLARGTLLTLSTLTNFLALLLMPLGDVSAITFLSPIIVAALAVLWLGERVGLVRWLAIGAGFLGALLVVRPTASGLNAGAALALVCAACYALYQISTRIVREAEPIVSLLFSGLVGAVVFTALVPFWWDRPPLAHLGLFVATGVLGAVGHLLIILALQRAEASRVSPFNYVQLVWAMLASFLVFADVPSVWTVLGAAVIVGSGLWLYALDRLERSRRVPAAGAATKGPS